MIDDNVLKAIISLGELIDKFLVNSIKIEKIGEDKLKGLIDNNLLLKEVINKWSKNCDKNKIEKYSNELLEVLLKQWDYLDIVLDKDIDIEKRKDFALLAQEMNNERVYWKNKINELCGHHVEVKKYGKNL